MGAYENKLEKVLVGKMQILSILKCIATSV